MVQVFCLWVVWSYCEDAAISGGGPSLLKLAHNLEQTEQVFSKKIRKEGPYAGVVGVAHTMLPTAH
eukprot:CAMPEP_0178422074 /NCGR_PEP_ID=MMETSP0689_2-20121128/26984_1 /TAXON_ID=160604 /ORGANISM="Amphidinium massartii, Strain CS-259" /LENGTH=65 /DNA_ID=CAMNT_0020043623 /DNA_START=593 /DNA_END=787 /DNA_ORIENTATION=-